MVRADGEPVAFVRDLLAKGHDVLAIDCYLTGEYQDPFRPVRPPTNPSISFATHKGPDGFVYYNRPDYVFNYNRTAQCHRIQDILTAIGACSDGQYSRVNLIGLEGAGVWCLLARPLARGIHATVIDADRFDPDADESWSAPMLIPGIRRAGDLRTAAAMVAPGTLVIYNTGNSSWTDWARDAYRAAGAAEKLSIDRQRMPSSALAPILERL